MPTREELIEQVKRKRLIEEVKRKRQAADLATQEQDAPLPNLPEEEDDSFSWLTGGGPRIAERIPLVGPATRRLGEGFRAGIESTFGDETFGDAYDRIRAENDKEREQYAKKNPTADMLSNVAGGIGGIALGSGGSNALSRLGSAVGIQYGDSLLRGDSSEEALDSAETAGNIQAGIEALPYVGKVVRPLARPLAAGAKRFGQRMENFAAGRALKHMYGNVDKAWEMTPEKDRIPLGTAALKHGIVRFGEKVGKSVDRAKDVGKGAWNQVEDIFSKMRGLPDDTGKVDGWLIGNYIDDAAGKIDDIRINKGLKEGLAEEADQYRVMGQIDPGKAQGLKNQYRYRVLDPRTAALGKDGTNIVNQAFAKSIRDAAGKSGVPGADRFGEFYDLSGQAGQLAKYGKIMNKRLTKNRSISLTDYMAALGIGTASAGATGDLSVAILASILGGVGNRVMRTRGNSAVAASFYKASQALKNSPDNIGAILKGLEDGTIGGPAGRMAAQEFARQMRVKREQERRTWPDQAYEP